MRGTLLALEPLASLVATAQLAQGPLLDADERVRATAMASARRRDQFRAGRQLVRRLLRVVGGDAANGWHIAIAPGGAPTVCGPGAEGIHLSISHSGGWVACVVADSPIGIDLEVAQRRRDVLALAELVCTPAEREALAVLPPAARDRAFRRGWTLKEAWLKRAGLGIDLATLRNLDFEPTALASADAACCEGLAPGLELAVAGARLDAGLTLCASESMRITLLGFRARSPAMRLL